jgi:hypothetical protein
MDKLSKYILSLVRSHFYGSVNITFKNGLPITIKEEKSIDTGPFKEEIREKLGIGWVEKDD